MAITQYYVDPSINANSGTGTIGDPFGDLQYALDTVTQDTSNGDQFNIKSGTAEVLTAELSLTSYGTPSLNYPLCFSGYTATADDGGIGIIDGNASYKIITAPSYCILKNLELRNSGANSIASGDLSFSIMKNCTIHGSTGGTDGVFGFKMFGCHAYDLGNTYALRFGYYHGCSVFQGASNTFTYGISPYRGTVSKCLIYITDTATGIYGSGQINSKIIGNSILCSGGAGINYGAGVNRGTVIQDNLVEGASTGIAADANSYVCGNAVYNSSVSDYSITNFSDNESLSASPFEKTGAATRANAKAYFAPANVGNVRTGAYSSIDGVKGAIGVQAAAGGGGSQFHPLG